MHEGELVIGEVRTDQSRYMLTDQVGSILSVTEARSNEQGESIDAEVLMTNDFDTFGRMKTGEVSFESGSAAERALSAYTYTGMRQAAVGGTTHHGARDYAASLSSWLQTDQYLNAFDDLSLSIDPITRDRHAYAGGNPIGYVDRDGHMYTDGGGNYWGATPTAIHRHINGVSSVEARDGGSSAVSYQGYSFNGTAASVSRKIERIHRAISAKREDERMARVSSLEAIEPVGDLDYVIDAMTLGSSFVARRVGKLALRGMGSAMGRETAEQAVQRRFNQASRAIYERFNKQIDEAFCSFSGETRVLMADGTTKPISQIREGDVVLARDENGDTKERVVKTWVHSDTFITLHTSAGEVITTEDHPFFSTTRGRYVAAGELRFGEQLRSAESSVIVSAWGTSPSAHNGLAYNLTVQDAHTYYVVVRDTSVLVHNTRGCKFKTDPDAVGEHSVFRYGTDGRINGYQTYEYGYGGRLLPTKRFRGTGQDHGGFNPPYVMDPRSPGARPSVPREPLPWELPFGY
jgi:RHS repeat-associated protein